MRNQRSDDHQQPAGMSPGLMVSQCQPAMCLGRFLRTCLIWCMSQTPVRSLMMAYPVATLMETCSPDQCSQSNLEALMIHTGNCRVLVDRLRTSLFRCWFWIESFKCSVRFTVHPVDFPHADIANKAIGAINSRKRFREIGCGDSLVCDFQHSSG